MTRKNNSVKEKLFNFDLNNCHVEKIDDYT